MSSYHDVVCLFSNGCCNYSPNTAPINRRDRYNQHRALEKIFYFDDNGSDTSGTISCSSDTTEEELLALCDDALEQENPDLMQEFDELDLSPIRREQTISSKGDSFERPSARLGFFPQTKRPTSAVSPLQTKIEVPNLFRETSDLSSLKRPRSSNESQLAGQTKRSRIEGSYSLYSGFVDSATKENKVLDG